MQQPMRTFKYQTLYACEHRNMANEENPIQEKNWIECYLDTHDAKLAARGYWLRLRTFADGSQKWSLRRVYPKRDNVERVHLEVEQVQNTDTSQTVLSICELDELVPIAMYHVSRQSYVYREGILDFDAVCIGQHGNFAISTYSTTHRDSAEIGKWQNCSKLLGSLLRTDSVRYFVSDGMVPAFQPTALPWFESIQAQLLTRIGDLMEADLDVLSDLGEELIFRVCSWPGYKGEFQPRSDNDLANVVQAVYEAIPYAQMKNFFRL